MTYTLLGVETLESLRRPTYFLCTFIEGAYKLLKRLGQCFRIFRLKQVACLPLHEYLCRTGRDIRTHRGNVQRLSLYKNLPQTFPLSLGRRQDKRLGLPNDGVWIIEPTSEEDVSFCKFWSRKLLKPLSKGSLPYDNETVLSVLLVKNTEGTNDRCSVFIWIQTLHCHKIRSGKHYALLQTEQANRFNIQRIVDAVNPIGEIWV